MFEEDEKADLAGAVVASLSGGPDVSKETDAGLSVTGLLEEGVAENGLDAAWQPAAFTGQVGSMASHNGADGKTGTVKTGAVGTGMVETEAVWCEEVAVTVLVETGAV